MPPRTTASGRAKLTVVGSSPDFDTVADELYGLAPEEFTAARNGYEKQARQSGDRELADRIHALAKPNMAAWLANQLVRQQRDELEPLLQLGEGLREATRSLAGDQLRQLSRQRHELVYALVQQTRQLGRAAGHQVSEDTARGVEDTLHAALADEQAAEQLLGGRLTSPLQRSGLGDTPPAPSTPGARVARSPGQPKAADRSRRAEQELIAADRAAADAETVRDKAEAQVQEAEQAHQQAQHQVETLQRELDEAAAHLAEVAGHQRDRAAALRRAEAALGDAQRRQAEARSRRDRLAP